MGLLVPENKLPSLPELHQALCQRYGLTYKPEDMEADFRDNAYSLAILLAPMVSPFATPTYGIYHGQNMIAPGEAHDHAWVNCMGTVIDPSRWILRGELPNIFSGESIGPGYVYEESHNFKPALRNIPERGAETAVAYIAFRWSPKVDIFLRDSIFQDQRDVSTLSMGEVTFLARLHYTQLFPHLHAIYNEIIGKGYGHLIPPIYRKYYFHSQEPSI